MKKKILSRVDIPVYILVAVFYFWLAAQIPYTHDDWDWGLNIGLTQLFTANLNARYAGNFFEVIMTRSELLRILIMGSGYFLLPMALAAAAWQHCKAKGPVIRLLFFTVANIFLLSMPRAMWQQTYGWTAGYANFGLSALFMVAVVGKILQLFCPAQPRLTAGQASWFDLFALVLIGQLFIENISIYIVFVCLFACVVAWIKEKKVPVAYLLMAAAAVLGLVIVFTSSIYQELWTTGKAVSGYRKLFVNSVSGIWETVGSCLVQAKNLSFRIFEENLTLMLGITALLTLVTLLKKNVSKAIRVVFTSLNSLFFLYFLLNRYWELVGGDGWKFLISTVFFLLMTVEICLVFRHDRAQKNRLLFTWLSVAGVMLPLLVTSEHGPRMFFTSNALLILFALQLLGLALETDNKKTLAVSLTAALVVTVLLSGYFGKVYYEIGEAKRERVEYIAQEVEAGSGVILVPQYPHTEFIWRPNPVNDLRVRYFKEFYGIPMETSLYF